MICTNGTIWTREEVRRLGEPILYDNMRINDWDFVLQRPNGQFSPPHEANFVQEPLIVRIAWWLYENLKDI